MSTILHRIDLRSGGPADLPALDSIMAAAFDPRFGEAWTPSQASGMLVLPGIWLTIAAVDGRDIGFTLCRIVADEAELLLIATLPAFRRRGVGGSLLRAAITDARLRGAARLHLEVREGNRAVDLYQTHGFVKQGVRRDYYRGDGNQLFDAHSYCLNLDAK